MNFSINFDLIAVGITIITISILGFTVFLNNKKSITNKSFFLFTFLTVLYGVVNFANYQINSEVLILWLIRLTIFFSVWHAFSLFQFFYVFPKEDLRYKNWYKFLLLPIVLATSILTLTPLIFRGIEKSSIVGEVSTPQPGPAILIFGVVVFFLVLASFFVLIKRMTVAREPQLKQYKVIFVGTSITFFLILLFNLFYPLILNDVKYIPFAPIFFFPFIAFTSYAIIKHHLFDIKVIATELITFTLWIFILVRTLIANSLEEMILNGILLVIMVVFGTLLIRSIVKEVKQREQIEKLAKEIQQSYELEKKAYAVEKQAKEELERLDKTKNQYLGFAQHNLRTPLTSMRGYADLLLNGTFGKQNKKTIEVIKKIQTLIENQIKEVNEFLDITQFQLGKSVIALKPDVDVEPILAEIVSELKFQVDAKGIYLRLEKPDRTFKISADRTKLKASLSNIINNAIKYTPKGGVSIRIESHDNVKIIISDTGIGISKENLKTLFGQIFERSEAAKKVASGSGIGLYLASQIIKSHNGKIWAESEGEGKGSVFHIELPLYDPAAPPVQPIVLEPQSSTDQQSLKSPL